MGGGNYSCSRYTALCTRAKRRQVLEESFFRVCHEGGHLALAGLILQLRGGRGRGLVKGFAPAVFSVRREEGLAGVEALCVEGGFGRCGKGRVVQA